ncbi:MAG: FHA domain-containing protein [Candidatus Methylacidiphilales bacterium]
MANQEIPEHLQYHGQAGESGCLNIRTADGRYAGVYLLDGEVVYAETSEDYGVTALFIAMTWDEAHTSWEPAKQPPRLIMREPFDSLLFQFAQIEDAGQTDLESIREMFGDTQASKQVKLLDLNLYAVSFEVLNSPFKGFLFFLEKNESLIGRMEDCDIILPDASISSHHCKIIQESHHIRIADLGSTNGTRINGKLINDAILQVGDELQVGAVLVTMHVKLKRNLNTEALKQLENQASATKGFAPQATTKLDPKKLRRTTDKVQGPITWRNLSSSDPKLEPKSSLFGSLFKKK